MMIGSGLGSVLGSGLGEAVGGKLFGKAGAKVGGGLGKVLGGAAGALLPFERGGMVKPKAGKKTQKALLHKGEMVIPAKHVKAVPKTLKDKMKREGARNM